jgi:hypothetical protein
LQFKVISVRRALKNPFWPRRVGDRVNSAGAGKRMIDHHHLIIWVYMQVTGREVRTDCSNKLGGMISRVSTAFNQPG